MTEKIAILLRGHNYLDKDRFGYPMDSRNNIELLNKNLIKPIQELYPGTKLFFATYESPAMDYLIDILQPSKVILMDQNNTSQISTFKSGIEYLANDEEFDAIFATRFDLNFIKPFNEWSIDITKDKVYFPWREYYLSWKDHMRVGDAIHIIGRNAYADFYNALTMCQLSKRDNLHLLYYFLRLTQPSLDFIEEDYWDSNTMFANKECSNPLYTICNRPKLATFTDWSIEIFNEFKI